MTRQYPFKGSKKVFSYTFATPREELLGTPLTLPTAEPTDPQAVYTVLDSDLPTWTLKPFSVKYIALLVAAGKFVTAGTLYWRMVKNGASVANGSASVSANTFYTVNAWFLDVAVGDVLGVKLWSSVSDSNYDYKAIFIYPTRFQPFNLLNRKICLADVKIYNENATYPTLSSGNPTKWNPNYPWQGFIENGNSAAYQISITGTFTFTYYSPHSTYGLWRIWYHGDVSNANTASVQTSTTNRPRYYSNYIRMFTECRALRVE